MTPQTQKTLDLFRMLLEQLRRDQEVLADLLRAYDANVTHLIELSEQLLSKVASEKEDAVGGQ